MKQKGKKECKLVSSNAQCLLCPKSKTMATLDSSYSSVWPMLVLSSLTCYPYVSKSIIEFVVAKITTKRGATLLILTLIITVLFISKIAMSNYEWFLLFFGQLQVFILGKIAINNKMLSLQTIIETIQLEYQISYAPHKKKLLKAIFCCIFSFFFLYFDLILFLFFLYFIVLF